MTSKNANDRAKEAADEIGSSGKADQAKGHTKELIGSAQAEVGSAIGNEEMEAKGRLREAEGKTDRLKGEIKEKIEDVKDYAKAGYEAVKDKIGEVRKR
jgi:uncharacterized protein YjbJ (UPF0337 family)